MRVIDYVKQGCRLNDHFKAVEKRTETLGQVRKKSFLCIRIDGIGLSKKYLKNKIEAYEFDNLLNKALKDTYYRLKQQSRLNDKEFFLCALICSDELSIFINNQTNFFDGRLYKITTTIASTFSAFFTKYCLNASLNNADNTIVQSVESFDGRPIELKNIQEVYQYLFHRYAIYIRNSATKVLRLEGVPSCELYNDINFNNIDYIWKTLAKLNKDWNLDIIQQHPGFFVPNGFGQLKLHKFDSFEKFIEQSSQLVIDNTNHESFNRSQTSFYHDRYAF